MAKKKSMSKEELLKNSRQSYISLAIFFALLLVLVLCMYFFAQSRQRGKVTKNAESTKIVESTDSVERVDSSETSPSTESVTSAEHEKSRESNTSTVNETVIESEDSIKSTDSTKSKDSKNSKERKDTNETSNHKNETEAETSESSSASDTKSNKELKEEADREKVYKSHLNSTKQVSEKELMDLLENKKAGKSIIYIGRASCPSCYDFVPVLDETLKEAKKEIYYFDCEEMSKEIYNYLIDTGLEFIPALLKVENGEVTIIKISDDNKKEETVKLIKDLLD